MSCFLIEIIYRYFQYINYDLIYPIHFNPTYNSGLLITLSCIYEERISTMSPASSGLPMYIFFF